MNIAKRVAKNSVWLLIANVTIRVLSALVIVLLARALGVEAFGQYYFALSFVSFFVLFTSYGFDSLIIRDIARDKALTKTYINNILGIQFVFSLVSLLALFIVSLFIGKSAPVLIAIYIFGVHLVIQSFSTTLRSLFHAYEKMEFDSITRIIEKILWATLVTLVIFNKTSLVNVALATLLSATLGIIITYIFVRVKITRITLSFNKNIWKKIIIAATPFALTGLFATINFRIDMVLLSFITNDLSVGLYSAAYKIIDVLAVIPSLLLAALYPVFSKLYFKNKILFGKSFNLSLRYVIILAIPIVVGVFMLSDQIIPFLYGGDYSNSIDVLKILIFISLISFINTPLFVVLNSIGKQKINMINTAFTALVNVILNLVLIPIYGIIGAAFSTIISELIFLTLSSYHLKKSNINTGIIKKSMKPLIASSIMALFIWYFLNVNMFIIIPIGASIYFGILFILKEFNNEDISIVKKILEKRAR